MNWRDYKPADGLRACLIGIALVYAFFAGLRTVADFDIGWQLATGRYVLQHHAIPSTDVFSYTAHGNPFLYPAFSGVILYLLFAIGGYAALSWISAIGSVAAVGASVWKGPRLTAALAIIAVPAIVVRTVPRADLFTTVIFAAFAAILWRYQEGAKSPVWALPLLMAAWVNLHVGFLAGFGLIGAYCLADLWETLFASRRGAALWRLRKIAPWLIASCAATLVNPWGWKVYQAELQQNAASEILNGYIGEWSKVHWSSAAWTQAISWRDPGSADWWMLAVAGLAIVASIWLKELAPVLILAAGAYVSLQHNRFQAIFAILVCIIGGSVLSRAFQKLSTRFSETNIANANSPQTDIARLRLASWALALILVSLTGVRIFDLVSDRYYLWSGQLTLFGVGSSWWFPQRAVDFIRQQNLPGNLFNDYNLGSYLTWAIPERPDYIDGRILPFGADLFAKHSGLVDSLLDSAQWQKEADARNIQTVIFSAARFGGLGNFPLQADCESRGWKPVYLDDVSIVFVRNRTENAELIQRLGIRCATASIATARRASSAHSWRASAERFQFLMNAASIDYLLSRDSEASANLNEAEKIFPDEPNLHLLAGQLAEAHNQPDVAERQLLAGVAIRPTDAGWYALAGLYADEHRYPEALRCVLESAAMSAQDYDRYRALGKLYLAMNQPENALAAFATADRKSPFHGETAALGVEFDARLAEGEAVAYRKLGNTPRAVSSQEEAVRLTPANPGRWQVLADLYQANGEQDDAARAAERAARLQSTTSEGIRR